jgi:minor extracellular serine protease Vpr
MKKLVYKWVSVTTLLIVFVSGLSAQHLPNVRYDPVNSQLKKEQLMDVSSSIQSLGFDYEMITKADGVTRLVLAKMNRFAKSGPIVGTPNLGIPVALSSGSGEPMMDVFVKLESGFQTAALQGLGFISLVEINGIVAGRIPLSNLESLVRDQSVRFVEASMKSKALNDRALEDTRVNLLHAGAGISSPYKGSGVVVGVLDSGIDFSHPDFSTGSGTRIRYLLEMKSDGTNQEWSKAQLDNNPASVTQRDGNGGGGHGTHVAGTAAGNGRVNANYMGVAPSSDIVFVKGVRDADSDGGFSNADVVYGVDWIFDKASVLGKPAVVNLSLGGNYGPLDGTSAYETMLSDMVGPGRIIISAAGNEGRDYIHAGGTISQGSLPYETVMYPVSDSYNYVEGWYDAGSVARVRLAYYTINNQGSLVFQGLTPNVNVGSNVGISGNSLDPVAIVHNGNTIGYYAIVTENTRDSRNGDGQFQIVITDDDTHVDLSQYVWSVIIGAGATPGRMDMWYSDGAFWGSEIGFDDSIELVGNTDYTVGVPATAKKVLSVGSYVTRSRWTDIDGNMWISQTSDDGENTREITFGDRSDFSSKGPTRDGRIAPDIIAPGQLITSALSSHLTIQSDQSAYNQQGGVMRNRVAPGGQYMLTQGTSMASPHVAGVVALMLEANPTLDYNQVVDILTRTARTDGFTGVVPNNRYGNGKVDAYSAVLEAAGTNPGPVQTTELIVKTYGENAEKRVVVVANNNTVESGFLAGTNEYGDQAKASFIALNVETELISLDQIRFWVGHRKAGATGNLTLNLYQGNTSGGPTGTAFYTATIPYSTIPQITRGQEPILVTHTMPANYLPPAQSFFISIEFGSYGEADVDKLGLVTSQQLPGNSVPQVWEKWNNTWTRMSAAWSSLSSGGGVQLFYEAKITVASPVSIQTDDTQIPGEVTLSANYPNPFNPTTVVPFSMPESGQVRLDVYDATGRKVQTLVDQVMPAGRHQVSVNASNWASGVYLYVLQTPDIRLTRKMLLIK